VNFSSSFLHSFVLILDKYSYRFVSFIFCLYSGFIRFLSCLLLHIFVFSLSCFFFFYSFPYFAFSLSKGVIRFSLKNRFDPSGTSLFLVFHRHYMSDADQLKEFIEKFNERK